MAKFKLEGLRTVWQHTTVEVEAATLEEAIQKADEMHQEDSDGFNWVTDEIPDVEFNETDRTES
jgi:hypothetical protein